MNETTKNSATVAVSRLKSSLKAIYL
jgi:hypothetical protein